jgi:PhnB protein
MAIEVQPSLSPHLCVDGAAAAIDFYVKAFNAVELGRVPGPDGKLVHAALQINGSTVLLNDDFYGVVRDPFGHHWSLGQPVREVSMEELAEAMKQQQ